MRREKSPKIRAICLFLCDPILIWPGMNLKSFSLLFATTKRIIYCCFRRNDDGDGAAPPARAGLPLRPHRHDCPEILP